MSEQQLATRTAPAVAVATRNRFFPVFAIALAATVLAGFAPTYYFRGPLEQYSQAQLQPHFGARPLSVYLHLHGLALSAWYVLLVIQTCLVAARRLDLHRGFGISAGFIAAMIPLTTWLVNPSSLPLSIPFICLVTAGVSLRDRPEAHKRLMLIASIAILTPASGRLAAYIAIGLAALAQWWLLMIALQSAFLSALVIYDLLSRRTVHPATLSGVPVCVLAILLAPG